MFQVVQILCKGVYRGAKSPRSVTELDILQGKLEFY